MAELELKGAMSIDRAVLRSLKRYAALCPLLPMDEPYLVAAIFRDGGFRNAIVNAVQQPGYGVKVETVFIHKKPMVSFSYQTPKGSKGACELGDALVVYREQLRVGQKRTQAVLFQAKIWKGSGRRWVGTDRHQLALYRHWPPFKIAGSPNGEIRLPPGDFGRVLGLVRTWNARDIPRVSPRHPTQPGCIRDCHPRSETIGTLGRAIRGLVRFEVGEKVDGDWEEAVKDMIVRVAPASAGKTFPLGSRGGSAERHSAAQESADPDPVDDADPADELDALLDHALDFPPENEVTFDDGDRPLSILLIDVRELG